MVWYGTIPNPRIPQLSTCQTNMKAVCAVLLLLLSILLLRRGDARPERSWRLSSEDPSLPHRPSSPRRVLPGIPAPGRHGGKWEALEDIDVIDTQRVNSVTTSAVSTTTPPPPPAEETYPLPKLDGATWVSFLNILLFTFRPDPDVSWPARVPRILWEIVVWCNLRRARAGNLSVAFSIWLTFLMASTGLADLFIWAPLYGAFVTFQSCEGGWLQPKVCRMDPLKGYSRLIVVFQAVLGGMLYLVSLPAKGSTLACLERLLSP